MNYGPRSKIPIIRCLNCHKPLTLDHMNRILISYRLGNITQDTVKCMRCKAEGKINLDLTVRLAQIQQDRKDHRNKLKSLHKQVIKPVTAGRPKILCICTKCGMEGSTRQINLHTGKCNGQKAQDKDSF